MQAAEAVVEAVAAVAAAAAKSHRSRRPSRTPPEWPGGVPCEAPDRARFSNDRIDLILQRAR